ncbi:hypothetical protein AKJ09_09430 [Labilithrix luteola]|uniref:Glycosyltransferase RgtA/B/C/D-like domain-containing protein n=1 Tax=Labilithrix luteola TaxID=1391654 RepID=A0A0K1QAT2_9BACT|nr:hypothetical protein [Labilithrix luteola]AKV02767.1 hypothetical protein AKJ09_09430 [Labilithrix luteola]
MTVARLSRVVFFAAVAVVAMALVATLAWEAVTAFVRPLDGVEGEVLFEADRLRAGLPLYTDVATGAADYGPIPARYLVLYPPVWPFFLSLVPAQLAFGVARSVGFFAWFGLLAFIVARAPRKRRPACALGAAFAGGIWLLAFYGTSARPDGIAVFASGLALERATRRSSGKFPSIDLVSGVLFGLAAWLKPNVVGLAPGAFVGAALAAVLAERGARSEVVRRIARAVIPGIAGVVLVSALIAGALTSRTGSAWVEHLLASTGQPPDVAHWIDQLVSRGPFVGLPLGFAALVGLHGRKDPGAAIATGALLGAIAWCILCLSKIGSASNYLLEPCVAAVIVLARADVPKLRVPPLVLAIVALVQALWTGLASWNSAREHVPLDRARAATIANVRASCGAAPNDVVLADEPGLELMMNGRIVQTPFQATHSSRRGRWPVEAWMADVSHPSARCLVMQDDLLERPLATVDVVHDRFSPELRRVLREHFELAYERTGYWVYRRRPSR